MKICGIKKSCFQKNAALFLRPVLYFSALISAASMLLIIIYILINGIPCLKPELFAWEYNSENVSLMPALVNTVLITLLALGFALPAGIGTAVYLTEYAGSTGILTGIITLATETLAGTPSIVFGLFGSLYFVRHLRLGLSMLSGGLTLAVMILPLVVTTAREALLAVPAEYRYAGLALGGGKACTVFRVILPMALPGIFSGVILAVGRIVGETAALIFTAGTVAGAAHNIMDSARTLSVHMYIISGEGDHTGQSFASAVVLVVIVLVLSALAKLPLLKAGRKTR